MSLEPDRPHRQYFDAQIPPHLRNCSWPTFEAEVLSDLLPEVRTAINKLTEKLSSKRVHSARVVLRRWQAVAQVIAQDDWKLPKYGILDKRLNKIRKILGELRDSEILLGLAQSLQLPGKLVRRWKERRRTLLKKVGKELERKSAESLFKDFKRVIKERQSDLSLLAQLGHSSAYSHLEPLLIQLEEKTRALEPQAKSADEFHALRIHIKNWRYFLTEFYGLTNLQLVKAQQALGKMHDLDRLIEVLEKSDTLALLDNRELARLNETRARALREFEMLRKSLPYGLRPNLISYVEHSAPF